MARATDSAAIAATRENNLRINRLMVRQHKILQDFRNLQLSDSANFYQRISMPQRIKQLQQILPTLQQAMDNQKVFTIQCKIKSAN